MTAIAGHNCFIPILENSSNFGRPARLLEFWSATGLLRRVLTIFENMLKLWNEKNVISMECFTTFRDEDRSREWRSLGWHKDAWDVCIPADIPMRNILLQTLFLQKNLKIWNSFIGLFWLNAGISLRTVPPDCSSDLLLTTSLCTLGVANKNTAAFTGLCSACCSVRSYNQLTKDNCQKVQLWVVFTQQRAKSTNYVYIITHICVLKPQPWPEPDLVIKRKETWEISRNCRERLHSAELQGNEDGGGGSTLIW